MNEEQIAGLLARGKEIGDELTQIGIKLFQLGEAHEARHILAALQAGNTAECDETCPLHSGNPKVTFQVVKHSHSKWEDVKARVLGNDPNDARRHQDCVLGDCVVSRILNNADTPCPINPPARTAEMTPRQFWVWIQNPGRWEVKGTGLMPDEERDGGWVT